MNNKIKYACGCSFKGKEKDLELEISDILCPTCEEARFHEEILANIKENKRRAWESREAQKDPMSLLTEILSENDE